MFGLFLCALPLLPVLLLPLVCLAVAAWTSAFSRAAAAASKAAFKRLNFHLDAATNHVEVCDGGERAHT